MDQVWPARGSVPFAAYIGLKWACRACLAWWVGPWPLDPLGLAACINNYHDDDVAAAADDDSYRGIIQS